MVESHLPWIVLFSPLVASVVIYLFFLKNAIRSGLVACFAFLISFIASIKIFFEVVKNPKAFPYEESLSWIATGLVRIEFGILLDPLSVLMLLVVTGVGSLIFLYSMGYMKGDASIGRYFACMSLFAFTMLGIVLSNNFVMLFIFWEGVAVTSYLLIGFWFEKPSAANAGNKAFLVNRLADFGFLIGILLVWSLSDPDIANRTFSFSALAKNVPGGPWIHTAALLVFCGVMGKSAQFPLHIWLPDAMEGPTPVSALIHAATMVAAGVFLLCRVFFIFSASDIALTVISVVGVLTAMMAALLAIVQSDIKKILAYSTISQLGYMVLAIGLGGVTLGMFHLTTHAFFKALLFLAAGSMIHGMHTQDIWQMGGLLKRMPITAATFIIGTLALCGIWPFAGFFSKDAILLLSFQKQPLLFIPALITAALTAFYMTRAVCVAVLSRHDPKAHESPLVMTLPLLILACLSITAGFFGIPYFLEGSQGHHAHPLWMSVLCLVTAVMGIGAGYVLYSKANKDPLENAPQNILKLLRQKFYVDYFFSRIGNFFQNNVAGSFFNFDWKAIIQCMVQGTARITGQTGSVLRKSQTGLVAHYTYIFSAAVIVLIFIVLVKG
jgi:NADH-quinone oxidoreductase subunit L